MTATGVERGRLRLIKEAGLDHERPLVPRKEFCFLNKGEKTLRGLKQTQPTLPFHKMALTILWGVWEKADLLVGWTWVQESKMISRCSA